ncbi:hypothetical protein [Novosphingobium colocasiae]|uniref:hypothetical protein n=1 Tax=Novosphingobium colocasiae TaxID=1256513 RepID=UPI0035B39B86
MRKTKVVTIEAEGRDKGKSFLITEKSAYDAEKWAIRALLALSRAGVEIPDGALQAGALGVLAVGLDAFRQMHFEDAEPLLEEMMACIAFVPDPDMKDQMTGKPMTRALLAPTAANDGDIEEVGTILRLRGEALDLHLGFSLRDVVSNLQAMLTARASNPPSSPTSPPSVEPSSLDAEPA